MICFKCDLPIEHGSFEDGGEIFHEECHEPHGGNPLTLVYVKVPKATAKLFPLGWFCGERQRNEALGAIDAKPGTFVSFTPMWFDGADYSEQIRDAHCYVRHSDRWEAK